MSDTPETLDETVRRADPDRWLATRFIGDEAARADVVALYALNHELARVAASVREPLMGEIRLTWWREAFEEVAAGKPPRKHPVVEAVTGGAFPLGPLEDLAQARMSDLDAEPFTDDEAVWAYLDATAGALMLLAARRLDPSVLFEEVRGAARAFGLAGLWRAKAAGGRSRLPLAWDKGDVRARVGAELVAARAELRTLGVPAFPAVAYAALARPYARGANPGPLRKRLRLTLAVMRGRI